MIYNRIREWLGCSSKNLTYEGLIRTGIFGKIAFTTPSKNLTYEGLIHVKLASDK